MQEDQGDARGDQGSEVLAAILAVSQGKKIGDVANMQPAC
jgi:hypothetical protein